MDLFLATGSTHKAQELQDMLAKANLKIEVYAAGQVGGMPEVEETESTLEGNARLKAQALKATLPQDSWVLADDSGLFVDILEAMHYE
jgi:XTP/dITP diphosphohydrolase